MFFFFCESVSCDRKEDSPGLLSRVTATVGREGACCVGNRKPCSCVAHIGLDVRVSACTFSVRDQEPAFLDWRSSVEYVYTTQSLLLT